MFRYMLVVYIEALSCRFLHEMFCIEDLILCIALILAHLSHFVHALYMGSKSVSAM